MAKGKVVRLKVAPTVAAQNLAHEQKWVKRVPRPGAMVGKAGDGPRLLSGEYERLN